MADPVRLILGPSYAPSLWDLGKRVRAARRANEPVIVVEVGAPINSEILEVAILSGSLYLIGIKGRGGKWLEFAPDDDRGDPTHAGPPKPRLPGSTWIEVGNKLALSSYRALRLDWLLNGPGGRTGTITYAHTPLDLIRFFRQWDGTMGRHDAQLNMVVLIFLVCELLRFRSIENICALYIRPRGGLSSDPVMRPTLSITRAMLDRVQEWHKLARAGDPDVWTPPPGLPDPLFM